MSITHALIILSHAGRQATSQLRHHSDTLMHTSLRNSCAEIQPPSVPRSLLLQLETAVLYSDIFYTIPLATLLFKPKCTWKLSLPYIFCCKASILFILRHHLGFVLIHHRNVQVFQIKHTTSIHFIKYIGAVGVAFKWTVRIQMYCRLYRLCTHFY